MHAFVSSLCISQGFEEAINFCHPLEVIYACTGLGGWPKLYVELGFLDSHGRSDLSASFSLYLFLSAFLSMSLSIAASFFDAPILRIWYCSHTQYFCLLFLLAPTGGYGFCHVPTTPGKHSLHIPVFRPRGSAFDAVSCFFLGGYPRYAHPDVVLSGTPRFDHHCVSGMVGQQRGENNHVVETTIANIFSSFNFRYTILLGRVSERCV